MKTKSSLLSMILVTSLLLISPDCSSPGPVTHYFTGTIVDLYSGAPVSGALVAFGAIATTTDMNGRFRISLGSDGSTVTGDLSIYKAGYTGIFLTGVQVDGSRNIDVIRALAPLGSMSGYSTKTISGKIYESNGSTEISDGTEYAIMISTPNGQCSDSGIGTYSGGYSFETVVDTTNCMIIIEIITGGNLENFSISTGNDLSVADPSIDFILHDPATDILIEDVTLDAGQTGSTGMVGYATWENGILFSKLPDNTYAYLMLDFSSSATAVVDLLNRQSDANIVMAQQKYETFMTVDKTLFAYSGAISLPASSSTLNFPVFEDNGPTDLPDPTSVTLSLPDWTLSIDPVPDANFYMFAIHNDTFGYTIASVISNSNSITLPVWLQNLLSTESQVDIAFAVGNVENFLVIENLKYTTLYAILGPNMKGALIEDSTFLKEDVPTQ